MAEYIVTSVVPTYFVYNVTADSEAEALRMVDFGEVDADDISRDYDGATTTVEVAR